MRIRRWLRFALAGVLLTLVLSACVPSIPFLSGDAAGYDELMARGEQALQVGDLESAMEIYN